MKRFMGIFGLFIFCFSIGYFLLKNQSNFAGRDPAAIKGKFDFSGLQGEQLNRAVKQRVLMGLRLQKTPDGTGISLGHFVFTDTRGEKKLACREYAQVSLIFEAQGSSVDGEKPEMELEGQCHFSPDMSLIDPLFLPVAKIVGESPSDGEFQFNNGSRVTVKFVNVAEEWPRTWILKSVKLIGNKGTQDLVIGSDEVGQYFGHPIVLSW